MSVAGSPVRGERKSRVSVFTGFNIRWFANIQEFRASSALFKVSRAETTFPGEKDV
jgi:hypothetical protein